MTLSRINHAKPNQFPFFDKVIDLLGHRNMMDTVYSEFSKVSHKILAKKIRQNVDWPALDGYQPG